MPKNRATTQGRRLWRGAILLCAAMIGCTSHGVAPGSSSPSTSGHTRPLASARGGFEGLELTTWTALDPASGESKSVPEVVLQEYASRPLPFPEESMRAWRACGVGVVSIPAGDVTRVRERMVVASAVQALQVPLSPRWLTAVSGARVESPQVIGLDSGPLRLERGEARLLVRAWAVPGATLVERNANGLLRVPTQRALVQVQVSPQMVSDTLARSPTRRTPAELLNGSAGMPMDADAGQLLTRLTLDASCDGGEAFVFYPLLTSKTEAGKTEEGSRAGDAPAAAASPVQKRTMGPEAPDLLSLGDVLLTDALAPRPRRERTLLVVLPHPPAEYRLIE